MALPSSGNISLSEIIAEFGAEEHFYTTGNASYSIAIPTGTTGMIVELGGGGGYGSTDQFGFPYTGGDGGYLEYYTDISSSDWGATISGSVGGLGNASPAGGGTDATAVSSAALTYAGSLSLIATGGANQHPASAPAGGGPVGGYAGNGYQKTFSGTMTGASTTSTISGISSTTGLAVGQRVLQSGGTGSFQDQQNQDGSYNQTITITAVTANTITIFANGGTNMTAGSIIFFVYGGILGNSTNGSSIRNYGVTPAYAGTGGTGGTGTAGSVKVVFLGNTASASKNLSTYHRSGSYVANHSNNANIVTTVSSGTPLKISQFRSSGKNFVSDSWTSANVTNGSVFSLLYHTGVCTVASVLAATGGPTQTLGTRGSIVSVGYGPTVSTNTAIVALLQQRNISNFRKTILVTTGTTNIALFNKLVIANTTTSSSVTLYSTELTSVATASGYTYYTWGASTSSNSVSAGLTYNGTDAFTLTFS